MPPRSHPQPTPVSARSLMDPQMAAAMDRMDEIAASLGPAPLHPTPEQVRLRTVIERRFWNEEPVAVAAVEDIQLPGLFRPVPVRVYRPSLAPNLPAIAYFHGGGWVKGSPDTHDRPGRMLARESGAVVFSVDYALAPEYPFPEPLDESVAVIETLANTAVRWGVDAKRIVLAGDSAGGNLALAAALDLRRSRPDLLKALLLFYGVYGSDLDTGSYRAFGDGRFGLSRDDMAAYWAAYAPTEESRADPRAAPLLADLTGLPPTHLVAASLDVLLDDTLTLARRLSAAGVAVEFKRFKGVGHGFIGLGRMVDAADAAIAGAASFARRHLE
ncbi:MAG: alpha/beta hydrolase fold domain-containing protein [Rhodospirillales bacterium]|jgi:acetyl esterase|nr:alpha/beta hydrolase fold domain-containing protein [Rhodospirillales bacterium]